MGAKKKPSPRGHPRLKPCPNCQTFNAPRTFFCKECNHPFYSDEYMANRLDRKRSDPSMMDEESTESVPPTPSVIKPNVMEIEEWLDRLRMVPSESSLALDTSRRDEKSIDVKLFVGDSTTPRTVSISERTCCSLSSLTSDSPIYAKDSFLLFTGGRIDAVSFNPTGEFLVTLIENEKVLLWSLLQNDSPECLGTLQTTTTSDPCSSTIKSVKFCSNFASSSVPGILVVIKTDRVELVLIERFHEKNYFSTKVIFTTFGTFEDPLFPTDADCRFLNNSLELLISNNVSSFVYFVRIGDGLAVTSFRTFGYNHVINKANVEGANASSQSTCVCFLRQSANFFLAGYSTGNIGLWDLRNPSLGPLQIVSNSAGTRRYLLEVNSSWTDPRVAFAAFQAGSFIDLDPSDDMIGDIVSIGGDVRSAQCFGIDSVDSRVFVAMSSGVLLTLDTSLRNKLRRPLTGYVCQWEAEEIDADLVAKGSSSTEERLISKIKIGRKYFEMHAKFFPIQKIPNNLKLLKASDGASNEGFSKLVNSDKSIPVPIKCVKSTSNGLVAYGTDAGIVHIFRSP